MKFNVIEEKENKLLKRKEILVRLDYEGKSTPSKAELQKILADHFKVKMENLEISKVLSEIGLTKGKAWIKIWEEKKVPIYSEIKKKAEKEEKPEEKKEEPAEIKEETKPEESKPEEPEKKEEVKVEKPKKEKKPEVKIKKPGIFSRLKTKLTQYKRVLDVARKPDKEEFMSSAKITAFGIILAGIMGLTIFLILTLLI